MSGGTDAAVNVDKTIDEKLWIIVKFSIQRKMIYV